MRLRFRDWRRTTTAPAAPHPPSITSGWFDERELEAIADRYDGFPLSNVSYATVRDYADSIEHLSPLTTAQGDLKDVQRPWTLKAILSSVPAGGRVLEIGGGQPYVADILARLGYEVWLVDPYDGSGNGPIEYEAFKRGAPGVKFVRELFDDRLNDLPSAAFDCIYSISVIEHISQPKLAGVIAGMKRGLVSAGVSIHAIDHVHLGHGAAEHLERLHFFTAALGLSVESLDLILSAMSDDPETYYLSAESHNRWRGTTPYDAFPMRVCVSVQLAGDAHAL